MKDWLPPEQRVVITGIGAVTPCGLDMPSTWDSIRNGRSGIGSITLFDTADFKVQIAGEVDGFDALDYMTRKDAKRADRFSHFAMVAADEAARQAGLRIADSNRYDVGVYIGSGAGGIQTYQNQQAIIDSRGPGHVNPLFIPMIVVDSAAVQVGIRLGAMGPNLGVSSACSTSIDSVGLALETLRRGDAKVMIAGGAEAPVTTLAVSGFDRLGALSRRNEDPTRASRPFDSGRDGFVVSEGSVVFVLETLAHARARSAEPIAELRSYAATSDARHLTTPDRMGRSATRSMDRALKKARLDVSDVGYINAHATGTPVGDPIEATAIKGLLNGRTPQIAVSSTKSMTGHLLGGAGALAIALTAKSLTDGFLPPTINLDDAATDCELDHVANVGREASVDAALVPCYGFGGHNSCVTVTRIED